MKKFLFKVVCLVMVIMVTSSGINSFAADPIVVGLGDVNKDGKVSSVDALVTLQVASGLVNPPDGDSFWLFDSNLDGYISSLDALIILQNAAGLNQLLSDDFSGDLSKWTISSGSWTIQDETLIQDETVDGIVLLNGFQTSNQTFKFKFNVTDPDGYAGIVLWYKDNANYIVIRAYPDIDKIQMGEMVSGICNYVGTRRTVYDNTWHQLKVVADVSGTINIYFDNNPTPIIRTVSTLIRTGSTGFFASTGGRFDDFNFFTT